MLKVEHLIDYLKKGKSGSEASEEVQRVKQIVSRRKVFRFKRSDDSIKLPENFKVGQAIGGGDCFFDSVVQGLKQLKPEVDFTVESLREVCKKFAQSQLENDQSWLKEILKNENEQINEYIPRIEFTANDIKQNSELVNVLGITSPIWGRSEIEGRIICKEYNVKLHILEKHVVEGKEVRLDQIVSSEGSRSVDGVDYNEENTIHIINRGNAHFEPILSTQEIQYNRQQSSNHDTPKEELKIPTKEKPKKKSQESGQQSPDFSSDRVKRTNNDPKAGSSQQSSSDDNRIQDESWTSNQEHAAGELKRSLHGNDYQLKLLMLFASKGKDSEVAFRLATEMAEAEKFDDLVFRYTDSQGSIKYRFLQAKHRQFLGEENKIKVSDLKSDSDDNDFSLQKYFISYLKDIEKEEFRDGVPEDFIICTNTDFDFEPSTTKNEKQRTKDSKKTWKAYFSEKTDNDKILNLGGKRYQFNKNPSIRTKINSELKPIFKKSLEKNKLSNDDVEKIDGFLDKLVFAVEQPSGGSLEQEIKDTIGNEFNLISEIVYNDFFKFMHDWMKHRIKDPGEKGGGRAHFLTDKDVKQFLNEARQKVANLGLISSTLLCKRKTEKFGLRFKDDIKAVQEIREFLSKQGSKQILIVYSKSGLLSEIKVFQILTSRDTKRSIFSDLKSLSLLLGSVVDPVNAFSSQEKDYLIITNLSEDAEDLLKKFYEVVKKEPNKKIVLITQPKQKDNIQKLFEDENYVKIIEDDDNKLKDLTSESQKKILETEITLFGKKRELTSLTTDASKDDLYLAINGDALTTLINGGSNIIGSKHGYDFDIYIDIPRTLTYQAKINKKCLKDNKNDLFAISRIEETELSRLVPEEQKKIRKFEDEDPDAERDPIRFIILDNSRDIKKDFDQLCRDHEKHNIHLLENKDSVLEWKQSHGSLFNLRRFILETDSQTKKIKDLTDSAIIAGEAGMGKSTILTTCSMNKDFLWPIRINLKDYQTDIDNANFDDLSGIVKFLSNVIDPASSKTSLINDLLQYCLKQQGQVTLLLDGYDEIKDHSQKKVELLLRTLKTTQGKVLITTRSYARPGLEDALGIFAHSLNPFSEEEQKEFLKNFWIERLNIKEATQKDKIDKFTERLLIYFHESNLMKKEGLVGIALQARMVAEIFQDKCKEYLEHEQFSSYDFGISNISDLYEKFIEYQYERYLKEKIEISGKLSEGSRISLTRSYIKAYGNLALKSLFSEDQIQELLRKERFLGEELQDIGLVKTLKNDGTADFLHPTYAEYFVADFLVNALRKGEDHPKYRAVHNFLRIQIFRDHNKVISDFIENKIKKENDSNLSSKWKTIQNCNLLKEVVTRVTLQPEKSILGPDHLNPPDDDLFKKNLSDLQQGVEGRMNWQGDRYYYNGDEKLINKLFQRFLRETDIKALETTLKFLLKANGKSYYGKANAMFSFENNIDRAVIHYFTKVKEQDMLKFLQDELRGNCIKAVISEEVFLQLQKRLNNLKDSPNGNKKKKSLKELTDFLIPENIKTIEELRNLSYLHYLLDIFYPDIIKRVKSYISSTENTQKEYTTRIIDSLNGINCRNDGVINSELGHSRGSFLTDILYHPSAISDTKSSINEIYKDKDLKWLERQGVLISRVLEILTPEMSKEFNSVLDGTINGFTRIYSDGVFIDLINYIVNRVRVKELPQIDKLAFLKMLVRFVGFSVEADRKLPFTPEQLETTLELVKDILNGQRQPTLEVSESIEYLFILGKAGLKLIDAEKDLLVLDPAGEFQYKLSSGHMDQIIELIKWKNENPSESREKFLKKCYEIVELKKGNLKRKGSESDLQELKRLKVEDCLLNRRKREAKIGECEFSWEDVDEFNEEKDEKRDFSKIKIDGEKFVNYIKDLPEGKQSQLIQLADEVKVIGESQSLVNKLIGNQKVMHHLGRVGRISGITMHGMMAKNVLADFLNGNYQGVAINVGFIAGGQGFAKVAEVASLKGLNLLSEGKALLGSSLRAASPFLARGTSAFVIYDLVNQVKAFKNGTEEALVGVVGDSIYLGVDAAEIGIEVAEAFEVLEGISSVTGPIGAAVGAVVFVGTDVYMAVKRVDKIDELIHLTGKEKFIEGLRAFIGMQPEKYIQELLQEKEVSNELVRQGLEYLKEHSDIESYVFPTGKSIVDSCRKVPYQVSSCASGGLGGGCLKAKTTTRYAEKCTTKFEVDLNSTVLLDRKRTDIRWSRARPDNPSNGELFCLPRGNDEPVPSYGSYLCENAIGLSTEKRENYTLIDLGKGDDYAKGFLNSPNIFVVDNGFKRYYGGNKDDMFILQGDFIEGYINGGDGVNTADLEKFAPEVRSIKVRLGRNGYISYINNNSSFGMENINRISGRRSKSDIITCDYNTKYVDGQGGKNDADPDVITVPSSSYFHEMNLIVRSDTNIVNHANTGNFNYTILPGRGKAQVNISLPSLLTGLPTDKHNFFFNSMISDLIGIYIQNVSQISNYTVKSATFSFLSDDNKLESEFNSRFDEGKFNITISDIPVNASYVLSNGAEIKMGNKGNMYMLENTNKSAEEIIKNYLPIANRLSKMSFFIQSLLSNETVVIGSGNHEVIHNNPLHKSHLVGNGGENVYVIDSEIDNVPEVIIHDVDEENSIDTIDLRNVVKKAKELQVVKSENDLLLRATVEKHEYFTVRLKDGVERYNKTHVIVENAPMRISVDNNEWSLKSQPLMFEKDKEVIVVTDQDVEKGTELITPRKGGNYTFVRSNSNDLMITNAFDSSITKDDLCSITFSRFYEIPKMKTLSIKFADKEIVLKDHEKEISAARNVEIVKREYKDQVYGDVFNHKSNVELLNAVKENNLNKVKELINQGIRIDVQDENIYGKKPIHIAVENNNKNIIKFLLSKGAKVTDTDRMGNTPLHYAAWRGCLEAAKFLVNKGANINAEDTSTLGKKPIHVAVENNHKNIVEFLLSKGVNTDEVDRNGWTPLHYTAWKGYLEVAKLLIEKGADVNAENVYGKRSIHRAAENDNKNIIELLLSKGVSVNDTDNDGRTPLHWASWNGHLGTIEYLIGKGADINAKDKDGKTPLEIGIARKYDSIVKYLEQVQLNEELLIAVKNNDVDKVKGLIENGASLEAKDENSKTPLHYFASEGNLDMCEFLANKGAKIEAKDLYGWTPLYYAIYKNNSGILKFFLDKGADIEVKDINDETPLHIAAKDNNKPEVIRLLLDKGARIEAKNKGSWTPLHYAAYKDNVDVCKLLLERKADIEAKNAHNETPLHVAAENSDKSKVTVEVLLDKGANINAKNKDGWVALHYAAYKDNVDVCKLLIERGASIEVRDNGNTTALDIAKGEGHGSIVKYLEEKLNQGRERPKQRRRRHHHGDHSGHLPYKSLAIDQPKIAASSGARPSSWMNDLFGWVKSSVSGLLGSKSESTPNPISQLHAQMDINGTIMLLDVIIRKFTDKQYISAVDQSISQLEAQGYALNITKGFEKVVEQAGLKSGVSMHRLNIDFVEIYKEVTRKIMSGKFDEISGVLSSYLEKACPSREAGCPGKLSSKKFDKFMVEFNSRLNVVLNRSIQRILHNGDGRLEVDGAKQMNLEPQSYLSNASVHSHSKVSTCLSEIGVTKLENNLSR